MIGAWTNHLWQSTLFAAAAGLFTIALRKNQAHVRYWLWLSASCKFLIPFALLISLGGRVGIGPDGMRIAAPAVSLVAIQIAEPFQYAAPPAPFTPSASDWIPLLAGAVWAIGFAIITLVRLRGWLGVRSALRASVPIDLPAAVEVRSTPCLMEPGVAGWLRPVLLLPAGVAERLTPRQLEAVLAHELCHVRRRDNLTAAIHMIVEAVFWFHPLVWWIGARLVEERERACDEEVLSLGGEPRDYAQAILNICKNYAEWPLACVSGVTGSDLKKRIQAILSAHVAFRLSLARKVALAGAGVMAVAAPIVVGIVNAPAVRAQPGGGPKF